MSDHYPRLHPDGKHYLLGGRPAFDRTFDRAMSFHGPEGLAAVRDRSGAYHIGVDGRPAYEARYLEAYGYYGGLAAVRDARGFLHIDTRGQPAHERRFFWSGNFQEGLCCVQDASGFFHLLPDGRAAYPARHAYCGDFGHGVAAVHDGAHAYHITPTGVRLHDHRFHGAGAFHKGAAVVEDERGYFHVDRDGRPIHAHRFRAAEPFYNGVALCTDLQGRRVRLQENGFYSHVHVTAPAVRAAEIVAHVRAGGRAAVLLRHAEREPIITGWGDELPLTAQGERQSLALGRAFAGANRMHVASSPLGRCGRTAELIVQGAAIDAAIPLSRLLGAPGPFRDADSCVEVPPSEFGGYATRYLQEGRAAGMRALEVAAVELIEGMDAAATHGLAVLVSHDLFVAGLARFLGLKYPTSEDWAEFLEGVCILWSNGERPMWRRFFGLSEVRAC